MTVATMRVWTCDGCGGRVDVEPHPFRGVVETHPDGWALLVVESTEAASDAAAWCPSCLQVARDALEAARPEVSA